MHRRCSWDERKLWYNILVVGFSYGFLRRIRCLYLATLNGGSGARTLGHRASGLLGGRKLTDLRNGVLNHLAFPVPVDEDLARAFTEVLRIFPRILIRIITEPSNQEPRSRVHHDVRHFVVDLSVFLDRRRKLHRRLRRRQARPLVWEAAGVWLVARYEAGLDLCPARGCAREFLPAVFVELTERVLDVYRTDTFVCGVAEGRGEGQLSPIFMLIFPKPSDCEGFASPDLFPEDPHEAVTSAGTGDGPFFLGKVEMIAHVKIKE